MKKFLVPTLLGGLLLFGISTARAQTFAQFVRGSTSGGTPTGGFELVAGNDAADNPASVLQTDSNAATHTAGSLPVLFYFQQPGTPTLQSTPFNSAIDGILTVTAHASDFALQSGTQDQQDFNTITVSIVAANTANNTKLGITPGANLLSAQSGFGTTVGGTLTGAEAAKSATFSGTDTTQGSPLFFNTVVFSSDYINFTGATAKGYAFSFSNVVPFFSINNTTSGPNAPFDAYINSFTADGTATFSAVFAPATVPEPGSVAMFVGLGVSGTMFYFRGRRRRA